MIRIGPNLRVGLRLQGHSTIVRDGKIPLTIFRDGREIEISLPVANSRPQLIPELSGD
jgi:hypothetical protein